MKIRQGFVSNSSSSSFCIAGVYISDENIKQKLRTTLLPKGFSYYEPDDYRFYFGLDIENMEDNETKKQFIERTNQTIKSLFPEINDNATITHYGWYNG